MKAAAFRITPRIQETEHALAPVTHARDQQIQRRKRRQPDHREMPQACAADEQEAEGHQADHRRGSQVRFHHYQAQDEPDHQQRPHKPPEIFDALAVFSQVVREVQQDGDFHKFRRLNGPHTEPQPAPRALHRHTDHRQQDGDQRDETDQQEWYAPGSEGLQIGAGKHQKENHPDGKP